MAHFESETKTEVVLGSVCLSAKLRKKLRIDFQEIL